MTTLEGMKEHCEKCGVKLETGRIGHCDDCGEDAIADTYKLSIYVEVLDANALYRAALLHAMHVDSMSEADARESLVNDDGINVGACLQMVFDPGVSPDGTSIDCSEVESI